MTPYYRISHTIEADNEDEAAAQCYGDDIFVEHLEAECRSCQILTMAGQTCHQCGSPTEVM